MIMLQYSSHSPPASNTNPQSNFIQQPRIKFPSCELISEIQKFTPRENNLLYATMEILYEEQLEECQLSSGF